jgi:hypothetical protein
VTETNLVQVEIRLKPCPFCGCTDVYIGRGGTDCPVPDACGTWGYVAGCKSPECHAVVLGPGLPDGFGKQPGLIAAHRSEALVATAAKWNRRSSWIEGLLSPSRVGK